MPKPVVSNLDFGNTAKIVNLPNPTGAQDAATKAYVDANSGGSGGDRVIDGGTPFSVYGGAQVIDCGGP